MTLKYFISWVLNVEEDDPIPFEIQHIYFCLHRQGDYYYVSFGGNEQKQERAFSFEYYPLEAQFFDIYNLENSFTLYDLKILVRDLLNNKTVASIFKNKNIYISVFGENDCYKLENE